MADFSCDMKQYGVVVNCQLSQKEEAVFFHEVQVEEKYYLRFDGCDHQFSDCAECQNCHKLAYDKLLSTDRSTHSNATSNV